MKSIYEPKKMIPLYIFDLLKEHTDCCENSISINQIQKLLLSEHELNVNRKTISNTLSELKYMYPDDSDCEYAVCCNQKPCIIKDKNGDVRETQKSGGWYILRRFNNAELMLIIDGLIFSKNIPVSQRNELVEKLKKLSSRHFSSSLCTMSPPTLSFTENMQLFYTVEILDEAISKGLQVSFCYCTYGTDKKLHPRLDNMGEEKVFIINPYQIVTTNARYYLIANYDKYDDISHFKLDYIKDIKLLDTPLRRKNCCCDDFSRHMAEHIYMFTGESRHIIFRANLKIINDLFDWFGTEMTFFNETEDTIDVNVRVNEDSMLFWALQYGLNVEILNPPDFRKRVADAACEISKKYKESYDA